MAKHKKTPKLSLQQDRNDVSVHIRVQQMENGFAVKTGNKPIHYPTIEEAAEAVKDGLIDAPWPGVVNDD